MALPHCYHSDPVHSRFAQDPPGPLFWAVCTIAHILLCLPQVLQYRTWCQELEKRLEASGVSEAVLGSP